MLKDVEGLDDIKASIFTNWVSTADDNETIKFAANHNLDAIHQLVGLGLDPFEKESILDLRKEALIKSIVDNGLITKMNYQIVHDVRHSPLIKRKSSIMFVALSTSMALAISQPRLALMTPFGRFIVCLMMMVFFMPSCLF